MSSTSKLKNAPLRQDSEFNWIFFVELILCGVLTLFFLFYYNRVVAATLSYIVRSWTWHKYRVYVDVKSFQISIIAGRIFFKGFRYHGNNQTLFIQSGYITWRYWLRNFRQLEINEDSIPGLRQVSSDIERDNNHSGGKAEHLAEEKAPDFVKKLPCRLIISLKGAEWFIYNNNLAYDNIVTNLAHDNPEILNKVSNLEHCSRVGSFYNIKQRKNKDGLKKSRPSCTEKPEIPTTNTMKSSNINPRYNKLSHPNSKAENILDYEQETESSTTILRLLPIQLECEKVAVVIGNHNTRSVLITKADKAAGRIEASNSLSKLDLYRQLLNVHFDHPSVQMKPNYDYKEDQTVIGSQVGDEDSDPLDEDQQNPCKYNLIQQKCRKVWYMIRQILPAFQTSIDPLNTSFDGHRETEPTAHANNWQGLSRYLDEDRQDNNEKWASIEYATVSTILESLSAKVEFYYDAVGFVRGDTVSPQNHDYADNINGEAPPEWGVNISLGAATINYGPWADRQRVNLQKVFFPGLFKDAVPAQRLKPGQLRVPTDFKVKIVFDQESVLRVPLKEESKNWKWTKQTENINVQPRTKKRNTKYNHKTDCDKNNHAAEARPFGWLDLKLGASSVVRYCVDLVPGPTGYSSNLDINFPVVEITTSVNHGLLWKSTKAHIYCDLSNPLKWNGFREWKFDIKSKNLELFILREHVFLLTDLVSDWTNGPPSEYIKFCPFKYFVNIHLEDFRIYLNVNDSNIINDPSDFDDNTFIILLGTMLDANLSIPLDHYRPQHNEISFDVNIKHGRLDLHVPPWNTHASFLSSKELATLKILNLQGKFQYCPNVSPNNTDTLVLDINGHFFSVQTYGFAIRYLHKIRDNYFGEDIQFKTLEEHQKGLDQHLRDRDLQKSFKKSNDLDIIMSIHAESCKFFLPSNLYVATNSTCIAISDVASDLRFNNYYMDFQLDLSTMAFSQGCGGQSLKFQNNSTSSTQLFVEGCTIFENRLFGLPPSEPTYVCNRDYRIGAVTGECTTEFLRRLASGIRAFLFSFDDNENVLPSVAEQTLHDVIFFRANVESLNLWLRVGNSAFFLSTEKITVDFNNWAGSHYSKKLRILVPQLSSGCIDAESAVRHKYRTDHLVETDALIQSSLSFTMIEKNSSFERDRQLQQEHIQLHDQRTHRCDFLLHKSLLQKSLIVPVDLPTIKSPPMPFPLRDGDSVPGNNSRTSVSASAGFDNVEREHSFLSCTNSSTKSTTSHKILPNSSKQTQDDGLIFFSGGFESYTSNQENFNSIEISASTPTSRQTSFYSAIGESNILPHPSTELFGSPIEPHFSLQDVEPDTTNLPGILIEPNERVSMFESQPRMKNSHVSESEDNVMHTSYMISLNDPIRGFCKPKAVYATAKLLSAMQAVTPDDLLDEFQIESINEIVDKMKIKLLPKTTFDLDLQAPSVNLRFLNPVTLQSMKNQNQNQDQDQDQFDVSISRLAIAFRSKNDVDINQFSSSPKKSLILHVSIASAGFVVKEKPKDMEDTHATISCFIDEFFNSLVFADQLVANARFKSFELVTSSKKVGNLAAVIHRMKSVTTIFNEPLSALPKQQHDRILLFTYLVITTGQRETEPLFLTRPSYVLRFTTNHVRTQDSWTIISRLHYLYNCLDHSTRHEIASCCAQDPGKIPRDAKQRIITSLSQWSSLDINDIENCVLLSKIFNKKSTSSWASLIHKPLLASFHSETYRLVIDPGPKQNTISMSRVAFNFEKIISTLKSKLNSQKSEDMVHLMILGISIDDFSTYLNWELYEMLQDILQFEEQNKCSQASPELQLSEDKLHGSLLELNFDLHVILKIHKASLSIDAINIRNVSFINQMEASYIVTRDKRDIISSLVVVGKTGTSSIKSYSQELILIKIQSPGVYVSYQTGSEQKLSSNGLKIAANCNMLELFLRQDIIAMIEVVDHIIVDEIAQIHELMRLTSHASLRNSQSESGFTNNTFIPKVGIALFLDRYHISVNLLESLTHDILGNVARASIATQLSSEIVFDFDIKDHSHEIKTSTAQGTSTISLLRIPPTNGRITAHIFDKKSLLSIFASVEPVVFDAAVLQTLLTTMNKPEFLNMIANLQNSIRNIKTHLQHDVYGDKSSQTSKSLQKNPLVYDAHLTFAGFGVFANALSVENCQKTSRLELNLGCVQMVAINCHNTRGPILKYPELRISLHQAFIKLSRGKINSTLESCGSLAVAASLTISSKMNDHGYEIRSCHFNSNSLKINLSSNTASTALDVVGYLQDKIKDIDLSRENNYLRKFRKSQPQNRVYSEQSNYINSTSRSTKESKCIYSLELMNVQVCWLVENYGSQLPSGVESEDLVLSLRRMDFSTKKQNSAQLKIQDLQLQMVSRSQNKSFRSLNSALLPEVIFNVGYVSTKDSLRLAFQAGGKLLDLRLTSRFLVPASALRKSFISATKKFREASANWTSISNAQQQQPFLGKKRLESLLIDADFAGAIVHLSSKSFTDSRDRTWGKFNAFKGGQSGKPVNDNSKSSGNNTVLRSPGLACKIEYKDRGADGFSLNADVKVDASSNILYPSVVPLLLEMSSTVKYIVSSEGKKKSEAKLNPQESLETEENKLLNTDPSAVLNRTKLNLGLRICGQEFGLSCQPIARVAATTQFEDIYIAVNTVRSDDQDHFFAASATISKLKASVQHVYSREATGSFHVENIILSLMNSKHVGSSTGLVAILKISPMKLLLNAKQFQDFLLFREIWMPPEMRQKFPASLPLSQTTQPQTILVQRYQQVAATGAFPWNAIVSIVELDVQLDLGQAIGKSAFIIRDLWLSSKKNSAWEQNLCLGIDKIDVESTGRMSGLIALQDFKLRTSIQWPANVMAISQTPLVQGSIAFSKFFAKAAFDYHAFLVADVELLHFLMYNVRNEKSVKDDRLTAILEADIVRVFCTTACSSQALALYQAFRRLILEKRTNLEASLSEIEKSLNRSSPSHTISLPKQKLGDLDGIRAADSPISLHTDVLVTLKALNIGVFPTTLLDQQVFKLEALDTEARFAVSMDNGKIHSTLGLTLGQLRIGLADVKNPEKPKCLGEVSVDDVVNSVTGSRGGTILKVPKVEVIMQIWQVPKSSHIDYIFKSFFEGKVEVGWNYSRISYIRGMWAAHSKALARQLGKPLPLSAVRITGVPDGDQSELKRGEQQKITAEVNVPQSKYDYNAVEPPVIETPQLRDMGEATPPLEWIGLHRDRLPNLTHQIVIVTLLELASQVEDAYARILGFP